MSNVDISIIIPTRNRQSILWETLRKAIEAIEGTPTEVIIVNDGEQIIPSQELIQPGITFFNNDGKGVSSARNMGASKASGKILFFIDDDMWINKEAIDWINVNLLLNEKPGAVYNLNWVYPPSLTEQLKKNKIGRYILSAGYNTMWGRMHEEGNEPNEGNFKFYMSASCSMVISKKLFTEIGGYNESIIFQGEDIDFSNRIKRLPIPIYCVFDVTLYHNHQDRINPISFIERIRNGYESQFLAEQKGLIPIEKNYIKKRNIFFNFLLFFEKQWMWCFKLIPNTRFLAPLSNRWIGILAGLQKYKQWRKAYSIRQHKTVKLQIDKPSLLIIIDNLKKGGAEILLAGTLADLNKKYYITLVTLSDECQFTNQEIRCDKKYTLGFKNKFSIFSCALKLKKIIKESKPGFIHSHLFYSSLIARIACPSSIPLFYTLHGEMSKNVFNNSKIFTFLEKKTIKKNHTVIAVSNTVMEDYQNTISRNCRSFVLKNYISDLYFSKKVFTKKNPDIKELKLVAAGNIKKTKNYHFLLEAFSQLQEYNISIDIFGSGNQNIFNDKIRLNNLKITFKNSADNLHEIFPKYDLYVSCSKHEGFGIAAAEAMASGLPLLLSDLPVFHEITFDNALFFDIQDPMSFVDLIKKIFEGKYNLNQLSENGIEIAAQYSKQRYLANLYSIYDRILQ